MRRSILASIEKLIADQREWIESRGGNVLGYVDFYGAAGDPDAYGDGGEAIYAADKAALDRYIALRPAKREG